MSILITYPALALVPAAALAWLACVPYGYSLKLRILCSGECNIRVDLLLLHPFLLVLSVVALLGYGLSLRARRQA